MQQLAPENPSLAIELNRLKVAKAAYHAREKQMAKNMASKLFPDLKKSEKTTLKNKDESNRKEAVDPDRNVSNDTSTGKERVEAKADGGSIASKVKASSPVLPVAVSTSVQEEEINLKGMKVATESNRLKDGISGEETKMASETTESGVDTPSALLMIVCSTAVLVLSLLIALYLK